MNVRKPRRKCLFCLVECKRFVDKFCSNLHQLNYQYEQYIIRWEHGEEAGTRGKGLQLSKHIKRYLFETRGRKCEKCGWCKVNRKLGYAPVEIDHKDGNARNNKENNLIILCPNCHSLTPTYKGLNKGKGRTSILLQ